MKIGTDCSGVDCPVLALDVPFTHVFSCEVDKHARDVITKNHSPSILYDDVTQRNHGSVPDVDLYVAGFPCQAFSYLGKRKGREDPRGRIFDHIFEYLKEKKPPNILLENVARLQTMQKGALFKDICDRLESIGYHLHHSVLNTKDYGLTVSLQALYCGISRKKNFSSLNPFPSSLRLVIYTKEKRPPVKITEWEEKNVKKS